VGLLESAWPGAGIISNRVTGSASLWEEILDAAVSAMHRSGSPVVGSSPAEYLYAGTQVCYTNQSLSLLYEAIMRLLFALLALTGVAGIVIGVLTILRAMNGPNQLPFQFENYGGPGPIIAGVIVLATSLYLLSIWKPKD
jgi:hypothetical protein